MLLGLQKGAVGADGTKFWQSLACLGGLRSWCWGGGLEKIILNLFIYLFIKFIYCIYFQFSAVRHVVLLVHVNISVLLVFNPLKTKRVLFYIRTQRVPRSKHSVSVTKTNLLMLPKPKVTVCSESHTKHVNSMRKTLRLFEC
jgi:hypothetical protein